MDNALIFTMNKKSPNRAKTVLKKNRKENKNRGRIT
jgi:hypothetical protein